MSVNIFLQIVVHLQPNINHRFVQHIHFVNSINQIIGLSRFVSSSQASCRISDAIL